MLDFINIRKVAIYFFKKKTQNITSSGAFQGCGGYLLTPTGSFGSVDGDGDGLYENNLDCRWNIFGGDNKVIQLTIQPGMDLEQEASCRYDFLKV